MNWKSRSLSTLNSHRIQYLSCRNSDEERADGANIENSMETSDNEQPPRLIEPASTGNDQDEYNFNDYDNELNLQFANLGDVAVIDSSEQVQDDEDSEAEDDLIKSDDNLLIVGHVDEDAASLEVFGTLFCCYYFHASVNHLFNVHFSLQRD